MGSSPIRVAKAFLQAITDAFVAQSVEQGTENPCVGGSIPPEGTTLSALQTIMREWLSGRASPCQGERREFESRLPLHLNTTKDAFCVFCLYGAIAKW